MEDFTSLITDPMSSKQPMERSSLLNTWKAFPCHPATNLCNTPLWEFPLAIVSVLHQAAMECEVLKAFQKTTLEKGICVFPHGVLASPDPFLVENELLTVSTKLAGHSLWLQFQEQLKTMHQNL